MEVLSRHRIIIVPLKVLAGALPHKSVQLSSRILSYFPCSRQKRSYASQENAQKAIYFNRRVATIVVQPLILINFYVDNYTSINTHTFLCIEHFQTNNYTIPKNTMFILFSKNICLNK